MVRPHAILRVLVVSLAGSLAACLTLSGCAAIPRDGVTLFQHGRLLIGGREVPPADDNPGWAAVSLPDVWSHARRRVASQGWYRFELHLPAAPSELWAIYLPRVGMNAAVFVNGRLVGDGGPFEPHLARNWNRPLLFNAPVGMLEAGRNTVDVRLVMPPTSPGAIEPVAVGPERLLRPPYSWRYFQQVTMAQIALAATLFTGLLITFVYMRQPRRGLYRWFALGTFLWSFTSADTLIRDPILPTRLFEWWTQTAFNWTTSCFVVAAHRAFDLRRPGFERVLLVVAVLGAIGLAVVPPIHAFTFFLGWLVWSFALGVYLAFLLARTLRRPTESYRSIPAFFTATLVALTLGAIDLTRVLGGHILEGPLVSSYIPPVLMVAAGWGMVLQLARALGEAEHMNVVLEERVAEKSSELERNYQRLRELERQQAVAGERDRIMQDMHDGMGGQLVSTLALVEAGQFTGETVAEALRDALDDLRLVIDSLDPVEGDLLSLLGTIRARLEPRLVRHGIGFDWQVADLPRLAGFGPERALQALRIVQEAITNVLKHAGARTIVIRTGAAPGPDGTGGVFVEICDDGRGIDGSRSRGRGIANMRRRAAALKAVLTIAPASPGTAVRLWLPLDGGEGRTAA